MARQQKQPSVNVPSRDDDLGRYEAKLRRRRRRRIAGTALAVIAIALLAAGGVAWAYLNHINTQLTENVNEELRAVLTETDRPDDPFYMLLLGIDKDEDRVHDADYGEDDSNYRTDTIILTRVDPQRRKVTLLSIPRDTYVDLGVNGKQKINAAFSYGGAAYTTQVISKFAGVPISHYAEVDMDGFAAIVDQVGGVTVVLPVDVYDPNYTGLNLKAGEQTLDGRTAALLGRTRHAYDNYGGGDFYRAANQRMLIGAVAKKVMSSDPITMASTISTLAGYVTTDMDVPQIIGLASQFSGFNIDQDIYSGQCPTISKYTNDLWYELCDVEAWQAIMQRVDQGLPPYEDESQDFTAGVAGSVGKSTDDTADDAEGSSNGAVGASGGGNPDDPQAPAT